MPWLLVFAALPIWAEPPKSTFSALETPKLIELGEVLPSSKLEGYIELRNSGDKELAIPKMQPSCFCSLPNKEKIALAPGETKKVLYRLRFPNALGRYESTVEFHGLEPGEKKIVSLGYDLQQVVQLERERLSLWDLPKTSLPWKREVKLNCAKEGWKFKQVKIKSQAPWVTCSLKEITAEGKSCLLDVLVDATAPAGLWEVPIELTCEVEGAPRNYELYLVVGASLKGELRAEPEAVFLNLAEAAPVEVKIKGEQSEQLSHQVIGMDPADLAVEGFGLNQWRIGVKTARKGSQGTLILSDSKSGERVLSIPIYVAPK